MTCRAAEAQQISFCFRLLFSNWLPDSLKCWDRRSLLEDNTRLASVPTFNFCPKNDKTSSFRLLRSPDDIMLFQATQGEEHFSYSWWFTKWTIKNFKSNCQVKSMVTKCEKKLFLRWIPRSPWGLGWQIQWYMALVNRVFFHQNKTTEDFLMAFVAFCNKTPQLLFHFDNYWTKFTN